MLPLHLFLCTPHTPPAPLGLCLWDPNRNTTLRWANLTVSLIIYLINHFQPFPLGHPALPAAAKFQARFISNLVSELPCLPAFHVLSCVSLAHLNWLSLTSKEQEERGETMGRQTFWDCCLLKSVSWSQMVADLFNSPLKVDSKEQVTSKWAALHASKYLQVCNQGKTFVLCAPMQQHVLWLIGISAREPGVEFWPTLGSAIQNII